MQKTQERTNLPRRRCVVSYALYGYLKSHNVVALMKGMPVCDMLLVEVRMGRSLEGRQRTLPNCPEPEQQQG